VVAVGTASLPQWVVAAAAVVAGVLAGLIFSLLARRRNGGA
jgi:ABC-type uncharacterized transport system permease subunit